MGCPFGFSKPVKTTKLEPTFFQLKQTVSDVVFALMEASGLKPMQMRDVCMATLLSYRVNNAAECKESVQLLYDKHYLQFTKLCAVLQDLEYYLTRTFGEEDQDDETNIVWAVSSILGYTTFHDQEHFKNMICE